jgi:DNA-binding NtrC family response regulator
MKDKVAIVAVDPKQHRELSAILEGRDYETILLDKSKDLETYLQSNRCTMVIIDLDTLPVDKRFFKNLKRLYPALCIMGLSERSFHPELEEAISRDIYACLTKPVDPDEFAYLLKGVSENESVAGNPKI